MRFGVDNLAGQVVIDHRELQRRLAEETMMADNFFIIFYIAVPVVLLTAAFAYYITERKEDIEEVSQRQVPPADDTDKAAT